VPDGADDAPGDGSPIPRDGRALDAMMRGLVHEMSRADLTLGAHIAELQALRGWAVLGFASFEQWGRERLGLERSALWQKVRLAKQVERLPEVGDAVRRGALSQTGAGIIARVADHRTVGAWLERGVRRTWMDLREEVEVAERWAGMRGLDRLTGVMPPNDAELEAYFAEQREVLSGGRLREELAKDEGVQMCKQRRGRGTREVRFRVPEDVFIELRMMEVAFGQAGFDVFLSFLCRQFWSVWLPLLGTSDKWEHIYRRDRYRCLCPTCDRRDVTLHHFIYRSRGGGDQRWNVGGVCFWCHLEGEHGGRLKVWGPAWRMRGELGRRGEPPVMVVVGREVVAR
jgi:hypothetical protein